MFSHRIPADLSASPFEQARRARGAEAVDLTETNPTRCQLPYPDDLLQPLAHPEGLRYEPHPQGLRTAREAVAAYYRDHGAQVDPETIVLTCSTSEAYSLLFKLLGDPGDTVAIPKPSYPLFDHLARLEGLRPEPYALDPDAGFQPTAGLPQRVRALVSVQPNNPTGNYLDAWAAGRLETFCAEQDGAWIVDEVFLDYPLAPDAPARSLAAREGPALRFVLGGLSKLVGLPQLKLAWIAVRGPQARVGEAVERLSFIADHYLSPGTPVQLALPDLLARGAAVREAIRARCRANLTWLESALRQMPAVSLLPPQGGWSAVLRVPRILPDEDLAVSLIERARVVVYPGHLFDFPREGYLVLSLLPEPERFQLGIARLLEGLRRFP